MLYSTSKDTLNSTRNYTEGDVLKAIYKHEELPERTNITLESFTMANMGGDVVALAAQCIFCLVLMICIETGAFLKVARYITCCENKNVVDVTDTGASP